MANETNGAVAPRNDTTPDVAGLGAGLQKLKESFTAVAEELEASGHVSAKKMSAIVITAMNSNSYLMDCAKTPAGRKSIILACAKCAADGLIPDGREAALVPYKGIAQYQPMYQGIVKRMHQTGKITDISASMIYENEVKEGRFRFARTANGVDFHHDPILFGEKGDPVGVYAYIRTANGGFFVDVLTKEEVMRAKASSTGKNTPWNNAHQPEMWKKTALKRLSKIAPVSPEVQQIIEYDNRTFHDVNQTPQVQRVSMLERLSGALPEPEPEDPPRDTGPEAEDAEYDETPPASHDHRQDETQGDQPSTSQTQTVDHFADVGAYEDALAKATTNAEIDTALREAARCSWFGQGEATKARMTGMASTARKLLQS